MSVHPTLFWPQYETDIFSLLHKNYQKYCIITADEQADQTLEEEKDAEGEGAQGEEQPKTPEIGNVPHYYCVGYRVRICHHLTVLVF